MTGQPTARTWQWKTSLPPRSPSRAPPRIQPAGSEARPGRRLRRVCCVPAGPWTEELVRWDRRARRRNMPEPARARPTKGEYQTPITTSAPTTGDLRAPDRGHRRMAHYTTPPGIGPGNYVIRLGRARAADSDESASYFELCRCRVFEPGQRYKRELNYR